MRGTERRWAPSRPAPGARAHVSAGRTAMRHPRTAMRRDATRCDAEINVVYRSPNIIRNPREAPGASGAPPRARTGARSRQRDGAPNPARHSAPRHPMARAHRHTAVACGASPTPRRRRTFLWGAVATAPGLARRHGRRFGRYIYCHLAQRARPEGSLHTHTQS